MREPVRLELEVLDEELVVWRLPPEEPIPRAGQGRFWSVTRTTDELSVVSSAELAPPGVPQESGWRCLGVKGPLDFGMTGVLASLAAPLAEAGISIFVLSTFDTDYLLVKSRQLDMAKVVLQQAGHDVD